MKFVLVDSSVMKDDFAIDIAGVDLSQFRKNPIMYFMHVRPGNLGNGTQSMIHAIGTWNNIQVEEVNGHKAITAEPEFDLDDDFAKTVANKVQKGIYRMASVGIEPKKWETMNDFMLLVESRIVEASIVDRGYNDNAVRLLDKNINLNSLKMKKVKSLLALSDSATESDVVEAINALKNELASEREQKLSLSEANNAKEEELATAKLKLLKTQLDSLNLDSKTVTRVESMLKKADFDTAHEFLAVLKDTTQTDAGLRDIPSGSGKQDEELSFDDLRRNNPERLEEIRLKQPDLYKELVNEFIKSVK